MNEELKVIKWIPYSESGKYEESNDSDERYYGVLKEECIKNNIKLSGEEHQYSDHGVPLFSDNKVYTATWRGWGETMASVWSEVEDFDYNYLDFYGGKGSNISPNNRCAGKADL